MLNDVSNPRTTSAEKSARTRTRTTVANNDAANRKQNAEETPAGRQVTDSKLRDLTLGAAIQGSEYASRTCEALNRRSVLVGTEKRQCLEYAKSALAAFAQIQELMRQ
jgi:hypothetical protein